MVYRVYVEKKPGQTHEADGLLKEIKDFLQIGALESVRVLNRYDVENIEQSLFDYAVNTVFSEPQVDNVSYDVPQGKSHCPVSLTSVPTPLPSVFRYCPRVSVLWSPLPRSMCWKVSCPMRMWQPSRSM